MAVASIALAGWLYRPWYGEHFSLVDFSEFLPILIGHESFFSRFEALIAYYESQGRWNIIPYALIAVKWALFHDTTLAWQWARFAQMTALLAGLFLLLRRFGITVRGSAAGGSLLLLSSAAATSWLRLTMSEPLALMLLLGAVYLAVGYQRATRWWWGAIGISLLLGLVILTKEVLVAAVPFVLGVAWWWHPSGGTGSKRDRRNLGLLLSTAVWVGLISIPILKVALQADPQSYAADYGAGTAGVRGFLVLLKDLSLPVLDVSPPPIRRLLYPTNALFLLLLASGWIVLVSREPDRRRVLRQAGLVISLPLVGALFYLPWVTFNTFYALPFLLGSALLLGFALDAVGRYAPASRLPVNLALTGALVYGVISAHYLARNMTTKREVLGAVADAIPVFRETDSILVATRAGSTSWQGPAATLERSARIRAPGQHLPPLHPVDCPKAESLLRSAAIRIVLVTYSDQCGTIERPTWSTGQRFFYREWIGLRLTADSLRVDLIDLAGPIARRSFADRRPSP